MSLATQAQVYVISSQCLWQHKPKSMSSAANVSGNTSPSLCHQQPMSLATQAQVYVISSQCLWQYKLKSMSSAANVSGNTSSSLCHQRQPSGVKEESVCYHLHGAPVFQHGGDKLSELAQDVTVGARGLGRVLDSVDHLVSQVVQPQHVAVGLEPLPPVPAGTQGRTHMGHGQQYSGYVKNVRNQSVREHDHDFKRSYTDPERGETLVSV